MTRLSGGGFFLFLFFTGVNNIRMEESKIICKDEVVNNYFIRFGSMFLLRIRTYYRQWGHWLFRTFLKCTILEAKISLGKAELLLSLDRSSHFSSQVALTFIFFPLTQSFALLPIVCFLWEMSSLLMCYQMSYINKLYFCKSWPILIISPWTSPPVVLRIIEKGTQSV